MTNRKTYEYRKANGLCVNCGDKAAQGKTRCIGCLRIERVKAHERYERLSPEEKVRKRQRENEWRERHPDRVAVYKSRQTQYNKRYKESLKNEW